MDRHTGEPVLESIVNSVCPHYIGVQPLRTSQSKHKGFTTLPTRVLTDIMPHLTSDRAGRRRNEGQDAGAKAIFQGYARDPAGIRFIVNID
jgi:hypothetical protein